MIGLLELVTEDESRFDLGEGCLQTVPLRRVLLTAFGDGEGVGEGRIVNPDGKFFDGGAGRRRARLRGCVSELSQ